MSFAHFSETTLGELGWDEIPERLEHFAIGLTKNSPAVFDGISAEDLASEAILTYLVSDTGLGWNRAEGSLLAFLCGVLKNKFRIHLRKSQRFVGPRHEENLRPELVYSRPCGNPSGAKKVEEAKAAARGLQPLEELIEAGENIESGRNVNEQLAAQLATTTRDIVNRKKMFRRRFDRAADAERTKEPS